MALHNAELIDGIIEICDSESDGESLKMTLKDAANLVSILSDLLEGECYAILNIIAVKK